MVPNSKHPISDIDLYVYAGYRYIHGENPIMIAPESPPLGKYMIGLSIITFGNQRVVSLITALIVLGLVYLVTYQISESRLAASVATALTMANSLFIDQIIESPQLDLFQLVFLLGFFAAIIHHKKTMRYGSLCVAGIMGGCFISIKIFFLNYALFAALTGIYFLFDSQLRKKFIIKIIIINAIALAVYTLTYTQLFLHGGSFMRFLGTQKWIFEFYRLSHIDMSRLYGNYLSLILMNQWRFWSEGYPIVHSKEWSIMWPVTFVIGSISAILLIKSQNTYWKIIGIYLVLYNIYLFAVPVFPRYLLLLFVPLHIVLGTFWSKIEKTYETHR